MADSRKRLRESQGAGLSRTRLEIVVEFVLWCSRTAGGRLAGKEGPPVLMTHRVIACGPAKVRRRNDAVTRDLLSRSFPLSTPRIVLVELHSPCEAIRRRLSLASRARYFLRPSGT